MTEHEYAEVQLTFASQKEALEVSRTLLNEGLVACVHLQQPGLSLYQWQGKAYEEPEVVAHYKTRVRLFSQLEERVRALHSYECPALVLSAISDGHEPYLQWLNEQLK